MKQGLIILCLLVGILNQGNAQLADKPVLLDVSIDPILDSSMVSWIPYLSAGVTGYIIHRWTGPLETEPIDTVWDGNATSFTWKSSWVTIQALSISISAWDSSLEIESPLSDPHTSMFLTSSLDSCAGSVELNWNPYEGWEDSLSNYIVFRDNNPIATLDTLNTSYSDLAISPNTFYQYYIQANHSTGRSSTSNMDTLTTSFDSPPDYINALGTVISNDFTVHLSFEIDPSSELYQYYLLRSENFLDSFDTIRRLTIYDSVQIIIDVIPEQKPYYYQLVSMNHCLQIARSSNIASTISLSTTNNNFLNSLQWNEYLDWENGVESYEVYRQIDEDSPESVASLSAETTSYIDDVEEVALIGNSGKYCYFVEAIEQNGSGYSKSNKSCVYAEPMIYMPNAFTPDGDGLNDTFFPFLTFLPDKYIFIIKNRWGNTLFETHDPYATWNGTFSGEPVLEGVYVYYVRAVSLEGKIIERMGQVAVLYN